MLSNIEVYQFKGSNSELCESLGIIPSSEAPQHFFNYTARSVRAKAAAAIAAGKQDEPFEVKTAKTPRRQDAKTPSQTATESLPSELLAILPAMSMKLGVPAKEFIFSNSSENDIKKGAEIPEEVISFIGFFDLDTQENRDKLLKWAGVPTRRDYIAGKLNAAISVLSAASNAKFEGMETENMEKLLETLTAFALTQSV